MVDLEGLMDRAAVDGYLKVFPFGFGVGYIHFLRMRFIGVIMRFVEISGLNGIGLNAFPKYSTSGKCTASPELVLRLFLEGHS